MRALKITGAAIAAVIAGLAMLLIIGIPSGFLKSAIQDRVEKETGYRLTIAGSAKISLWPTLNISLGDLTLQDPNDRDGSKRVNIGNLQADMTLSSVWSGHPHISELVITRPVAHRPLLRERIREAPARTTKSTGEADAVKIDRVKIVDGAVVLSNQRDRFESRIDGINANAVIDDDHNIKATGIARADGNSLKFDIKALAQAERQSVPVELALEAPGLLRAPVTAKAEVRLNGAVVMINSLSGALGDGTFNGWASVDLASKPLLKLDLDFQRLDLTSSSSTTTTASPAQGWSDEPIILTRLNYLDAQVRVSATQLDIGKSQFAPAAVDATLAGGVLKASSNLGAYGGQANGEVIVDASSGNPNFAMHCDLVGVRAAPLLTSVADFDKVDGTMQAKIAARSAGASEHAIMAGMSGTAFVIFQDGAIRGVNVAQMIRSLTSTPLNGWQDQQGQATDLSQFSASFQIDRGQAVTTDLNLVGPLVRITGAGTIDLGTKMIGFRVEPKLVMTTEGQTRTADPVGFGVPVMISGPWSHPRIYPDMQGILDNPDGAYAKLREMGKGLFGSGGGGLGGMLGGLGALTGNPPANGGNNATNDPIGGNIAGAIGNLLQKGFANQSRSIPAPGQRQAAPPAQAQPAAPTPAAPADQARSDTAPQDSQPMNDVLKQLFNR